MNTAIVRGLEQAVAELYNKIARASGGQETGVVSVKAFGATGNGVTDDSAAIQRAANATAATGTKLWFPAGVYRVAATVNVPSESYWYAVPGTATLRGDIAPDGFQQHAMLLWQNVYGGTTTLAANVVAGTDTMSLTTTIAGAVAPGATIAVTSTALRIQYYTVQAVTGAGPFTVTVDRPIREAYVAPGTVFDIPYRPRDITLDGLNMSGRAQRFIEAIGALDCEVRNGVFDATAFSAPADIVASFDVGGLRNTWRNISVILNGADITSGALALESQESSQIVDCYVVGASASSVNAFAVYDSFDCLVEDSEDENSYVGLLVTSDGNAQGSDGTRIVNHRSYTSTFAGVYVAQGSTNTVLQAPSLRYLGHYGLLTDAGVSGLSVLGGEFGNAAAAGILVLVASGATEVKLLAVDFIGSDPTSSAVQMNGIGDVALCDCTFSGTFGTMISHTTGAEIETSGLSIFATTSGLVGSTGGNGRHRGWYFSAPGGGASLIVAAAGRNDFSECQFIVTDGAGGNLFETTGAAAVMVLSGIIASSAAGFGMVSAGGTIRQGSGLDFGGYSAGYLNAGGFTNRKQTVVANGATPVAIPWPDAKATDVLQLELQTVGGTVGHPTYTITAGTGFTVTSQALDTSTYEYFIP